MAGKGYGTPLVFLSSIGADAPQRAYHCRNQKRHVVFRAGGGIGLCETAGFEPDIMMLYGSPGAMTQIMMAKNWLDGKDILSTMTGHAACVYYVVPALKERQWRMSIPCGGDLRRTGCDDYSMVFSAPADVLSDLLTGLKVIQDEGCGLPSAPSFAIEYPLEKSYVEIGKMIGMDWVR